MGRVVKFLLSLGTYDLSSPSQVRLACLALSKQRDRHSAWWREPRTGMLGCDLAVIQDTADQCT
jgi:hypothetical protein